MSFGAGFAVEPSHRDDLDRYPLALRFELNGIEGLAGVLRVGDIDLLNLASASLQEFEHRVTALDLLSAESLFVTGAR
jgi:hypothetical protein